MSDIESKDVFIKKIETDLKWRDLYVKKDVFNQIKEIETWLKLHSKQTTNNLVLFHGPSGTGKTLSASLLGKYTNKEVYRIDLSMVFSKYIGETEKNLNALFKKTSQTGWILFFDEADALFGKRTTVKDEHDKYANQEVSYLLQRIETHAGLVIISLKKQEELDAEIKRLFHTIIHFKKPSFIARKFIWLKNLFIINN